MFLQFTSITIAISLMAVSCARPPQKSETPAATTRFIEVPTQRASPAKIVTPISEDKVPAYCDNFITEEKSAKNEIETLGFNDQFSLFWIGSPKTRVNFWTNDGGNTHFEITSAPLSIRFLDDPRSNPRIICNESTEKAELCISNLDLVLYEIRRIREQVEVGKSFLDEGKRKTFECTETFISIETEKLAIERRWDPPPTN